MKISMRTFSDSSNEFPPSFRKRLHPFQGLFARDLLFLRPLNLDLFNWFHDFLPDAMITDLEGG